MAPTGDDFKPRQFKDAEAYEVLPKIFLGSLEAAKDNESLQSNGVTHILTVNGTKPSFEDDFKYKIINYVREHGPLTPHLDGCMAFVKEGVKDGGILIHCTHGVGRSVPVTVAAVMTVIGEGLNGGVIGDFDEAFTLVKERRSGLEVVFPSAIFPFLEEVKEWGKRMSNPSDDV